MSYNESLSANSNYPPMSQSDWDRAPWNQEDPPYKKITVTVCLSISKEVEIEVNDYTPEVDYDEDSGNSTITYDFSTCDLQTAVEEQVDLPIKGWNVDDFEVIYDDNQR